MKNAKSENTIKMLPSKGKPNINIAAKLMVPLIIESLHTWTCHICNRERPDDKISVYKTDISTEMHLPSGSASQYVRYCNDNPDCIEKAKTFRFFK